MNGLVLIELSSFKRSWGKVERAAILLGDKCSYNFKTVAM